MLDIGSVNMTHDIIDLLRGAKEWCLTQNDQLCAKLSDSDLLLHIAYDEDLNKVHPLLADTLRANIKYRAAINSDLPKIGNVRTQTLLTLIIHGPIRVQSIYDQKEYLFSHLLKVEELEYGNFTIKGTKLALEIQSLNGRDIPIVRHTTRFTVEVSKEYLNAHYQGWEERWRIFVDIGLEDSDFFDSLFRPEVTNPFAASEKLDNIDLNI